MKALLGTKIGMTQILQEDGVLIPVTLVQAGPCIVTQIKTTETDGYNSVQLALGGGKNISKSVKAHVAKAHKDLAVVRKPGSIGSMYPQKVFKGKKMAGHMGAEQVTVAGLRVAYIDLENNLIGFKGAIPGPKKSLVSVVGA